ncbi:hypothetical protein [Pseudomonas sp.]|uniref:hypothetical protein n=1 Tax=Pseudomonas sp. TaxID=306 RepID=UPI003FD76D58
MTDINQTDQNMDLQTSLHEPFNAVLVDPLKPIEPLHMPVEVDFVVCPQVMKRASIAAQARSLLMNYALGH